MKHTGCLHFITLMNLLYLPTSVNCPQDIILHIQVVHRLQVKSMHSLQSGVRMHSLIRVWFLNPFRLPSSQCEAYSQHLYKCQCCFVVDCILQILFSSYPISLSANVCPSPNLENVLSDSSRTNFKASSSPFNTVSPFSAMILRSWITTCLSGGVVF